MPIRDQHSTLVDKVGTAVAAVLTLAGLVALSRYRPLDGLPVAAVLPAIALAALILGGVLGGVAVLMRGCWPPKRGSFTLVLTTALIATFLSCFGGTFTLLLLGYGGPPSVTVNDVPVQPSKLSDWGLLLVGWPLTYLIDLLAVASWLGLLSALLHFLAHLFFEFPNQEQEDPKP